MEYSYPSFSNEHPISYPLAASSSSSSVGKDKVTKQKCGDPDAKTKRSGHGKKSSPAASAQHHHHPHVKLSTDAQSVAARERRHRISERFKILQSLVPGGSKMDTVSMLEEAIHYVKFLKAQIWLHQTMIMSTSSSSVDDLGKRTNDDNNQYQTMWFQLPHDHHHRHESYAQLVMMPNNPVGDPSQGMIGGGDVGPMMFQTGYANYGTEFEDNNTIYRFS